MIFDINLANNPHRYNLPNVNEVAAVFVGDDITGIPKRRIKVFLNQTEGGFRTRGMSALEGACDPLIYPLFFPTGGTGYDESLKKIRTKGDPRVSMLQFYSSLFSIREYFDPIFYGGKLFQQIAVDEWVKIEENRLNYFRFNQTKIRADNYKGLCDHLVVEQEVKGANIGRIILPSSFEGGERAMRQHYQDAMAIVSATGKPDLFITMTTNPKWREIEENLFPGQQASDRPDLVSRVFELKKKAMLDDVLNKQVFGLAVAYVWVIEFQKRGFNFI
jgi:hypothetical protein